MKKDSSILFAAISLLLIAVIVVYIPLQSSSPPPSSSSSPFKVLSTPIKIIKQPPSTINFKSSSALLAHFKSENYLWPINNESKIPSTLIQSMPSDINTINDSKTRKSIFIRIMLPIILEEQKHIRSTRKTLELALQSNESNTTLRNKVSALFSEYNINKKLSFKEKGEILLSRFDELPLTLILAQAAIESGWGTSRFSRVGNSLFGEWTYNKSEGIVPLGRESGKTHRIKAFPSLRGSIASYLKNLNRNKAYKELRQIRAEMRLNNQPLDSRKLAQGLQRYSQKGQAYVTSVLEILNSKEFKLLETLNLDAKS